MSDKHDIMKKHLKEKVKDVVNSKLSDEEVDELVGFFKQALADKMDGSDDGFFKDLAVEMTTEVKELAFLIISFRKDLKSKIHPEITELTTKCIPRANDQLEAVIETTEGAANKIMDNLEHMQENTEKMEEVLTSLREGSVKLGDNGNGAEVKIDQPVQEAISPVVDYMKSHTQGYASLISDSFVQMSFQDLTGQRIRRIMGIVGEVEEKLKKMIISFGIKISERGKNPNITTDELEKAVEDKIVELAGPQKDGKGLDQADIDALLASI